MPSRQRCAYCRRREAVDLFRPFCSERCKMADLGRWLSGDYRVAGETASGTDRPDDGDADPDAIEPRH